MKFFVHAPTHGSPYPLAGAMTPPLTRTYAGWSSRGRIYGQPGTQAVPIAMHNKVHQGGLGLANIGISRSSTAPNVIFPPLYWEAGNPVGEDPGHGWHGAHEHAPVSINSDNQMPVPAKRAPNVLVFKPYRPRKGGQRQVYQPQVVQSWRGMKGTSNG